MASNRVKADRAAGPAQQTVVGRIYIQSLHFFFLLLWSRMNSRESVEPINALWSMEAPSLECNLYSTEHWLFFSVKAECLYVAFFLFVNKVQWFSGGLCAGISHSACNREPLSESDRVRGRKREIGLGNEARFSQRYYRTTAADEQVGVTTLASHKMRPPLRVPWLPRLPSG